MNNFERLLDGTANGIGRWPDQETGENLVALGTTMKQLRSWAQYADNDGGLP